MRAQDPREGAYEDSNDPAVGADPEPDPSDTRAGSPRGSWPRPRTVSRTTSAGHEAVGMVAAARKVGLDVHTEVYAYGIATKPVGPRCYSCPAISSASEWASISTPCA